MSKILKHTPAEINAINNTSLKSTLKELVMAIEENENKNEEGATAHAGCGTGASNALLEQILTEVKSFNTERDEIKKDLNDIKESNDQMLQILTQQQRFLEDIDSERRASNIYLGVPEAAADGDEAAAARADEVEINTILLSSKIDAEEINSLQRLGKRDPAKKNPRPIKVTIQSSGHREHILNCAQNLTGAYRWYTLRPKFGPASTGFNQER